METRYVAPAKSIKQIQKAWKNRNFELQDIHFKTPGSSISIHVFRTFSRKMMNHWIINPVGFDVLDFWCVPSIFVRQIYGSQIDPDSPSLPSSVGAGIMFPGTSFEFWRSTDYVFLAKENNVWKIVEKMTHLYMILEILYDSLDDCCFFRWKIPQFQNCCSSSLRQ